MTYTKDMAKIDVINNGLKSSLDSLRKLARTIKNRYLRMEVREQISALDLVVASLDDITVEEREE